MSDDNIVVEAPIKAFSLSIENNAIAFCRLIEGLSKTFSDVNFRFNSEGISICEIDDGRIGLGRIFISKYDLENYEIEEDFKWSLNLDNFNKILKRFSTKKDSKIVIAGKTIKSVQIQISNDDLNDNPRKFSLENLSISDDTLNFQAMEDLDDRFTANIDVKLSNFSRLLKDVELYSETITFETMKKQEKIMALAEGIQGDYEQKITIEGSEFDDIDNDFRIVWSVEYMKIFERIGKAFGTSGSKSFQDKILMLSMAKDTPIKAEFELFNDSFIKFWIAPRIEESEDDDCDDCYNDPCTCNNDDEPGEEKQSDEEFKEEIKSDMEKSNKDLMEEEEEKLRNRKHNQDCECNKCNEEYYSKENIKDDELAEENLAEEQVEREMNLKSQKIAEDREYYAKLKQLQENLDAMPIPESKTKPELVW